MYYSSDQGGTATLWRIGVKPATGAPVGDAVRLPLPVAEAGFFSLSRDGKRLAYTVDSESWNIEKLGFDPVALKAVWAPVAVTAGQNGFERQRVSPDGRRLVFESDCPSFGRRRHGRRFTRPMTRACGDRQP